MVTGPAQSERLVKAAYIAICQVADMDRAVTFYRDVLGLTPGYTTPYWSDFTLGEFRIGLHPPFNGAEPPDARPKKGWILGIETDDIRALRRRLEAAGAAITGEWHDTPVGVILDFADPDGNPIQAMQRGIRAAEVARAGESVRR
jgi:predicted enzyme related to lactoylglutathione lyase